MEKLKKQVRNKWKGNRLAALLCVSLLLLGCGNIFADPAETKDDMEKKSYAEQVLEIGILADCSDPYAVVMYESFIREAGQNEEAIVVELHDCRNGYESRMEGLTAVKETGIDVLLIDGMNMELDSASRKELAEAIEVLEVPVFYFGPWNPMNQIAVKGTYIGLSEEAADAYAAALTEDRFDEAGYREQAEKAGRDLFTSVLSEFGWE